MGVQQGKHESVRRHWYRIIFKADTPEGRLFDVVLLWLISLSVLVVMLDSVGSVSQRWGLVFSGLEYFFTAVFTVEYLMRIWVSPKPRKYVMSFWGMIDLLGTLPTYLALFIEGTHVFMILRFVRILRVFRVFRLTSFINEAAALSLALKKSQAKIVVFFGFILVVVVIVGSAMYTIEPPEAGFTSIPRSIYWAIVTITTVGYGDIAPVTPLGQFLSAALMILGYSVIAIPTGLVSVNWAKGTKSESRCEACGENEHASNAKFCHQCGNLLMKQQ